MSVAFGNKIRSVEARHDNAGNLSQSQDPAQTPDGLQSSSKPD